MTHINPAAGTCRSLSWSLIYIDLLLLKFFFLLDSIATGMHFKLTLITSLLFVFALFITVYPLPTGSSTTSDSNVRSLNNLDRRSQDDFDKTINLNDPFEPGDLNEKVIRCSEAQEYRDATQATTKKVGKGGLRKVRFYKQGNMCMWQKVGRSVKMTLPGQECHGAREWETHNVPVGLHGSNGPLKSWPVRPPGNQPTVIRL